MRKSTLIWFVLLGFLATALLAFAQDAGPQPSQINIDVRDYYKDLQRTVDEIQDERSGSSRL